MQSFTILAQAPASVLSDLPAKQAQSMAASAQGISLPAAGLLAAGAVIAGVAGGSSGSSGSGTPVDPAKKALDDKLDAITLRLQDDSGRDKTDRVTNNGTLVLKDASGTELATEPTGLQFSSDAGTTWDSLSKFNAVEGPNSVILRVKGEKDLVSKSSSAFTFTLDTVKPSVNGIKAELVHDITSDDGVDQTDGITSIRKPFLEGTAEVGSTVDVSFKGGVTGFTNAVVGADGKWKKQVNVELNAGVWTPIVEATDAAGNKSDPVPGQSFTIAVITAGLRHDKDNDTGVLADDDVTYNTFPTLEGYSLPDAKVEIGVGGQKYPTRAAKDDGRWSVGVGFLADGDYTPTIATLEVPGVSETPISGTKFTVDTKAPDVSKVTVALDAASDTGAKGDGLTSSTAPTISGVLGNAAPGDLVSLTLRRLDGPEVQQYKNILVGADGKWSKVVDLLTAGEWAPSVTVSDLAGNSGSGSKDGDSFTIADAAISTISLDISSETGNSNDPDSNDGVTSNTLPTLSGMVDVMREGTTVLVTLGTLTGTVTPNPGGDWTYTPSEALADGVYSAKVVVKDVIVGTDSAPAVQTITIDSKAPKLVHPADLVQPAGAAFTKLPAYGDFADKDEVLFEDVGVTAIGFDDKTKTGAFKFDVTGAVSAPINWKLIDGSPTFGWVRATVTDLAGNVSVDEYQVAAVTTTTPLSKGQEIKETSFAPALYVDNTTGSGLTVTLTATVGSVIQMGDGNDTVNLNAMDATDFSEMKFAALDGGAGTGDILRLNDTAGSLGIDLGTFNLAGGGEGQILTRFESLEFSTADDVSGYLSLSPEDLYRLKSDLIDPVGGSWRTLVVSGGLNDDDFVSLVPIDVSSEDGVDQDFYQVGEEGKFTATGAAGSGYTKVRAIVTDADGSHGVELLIASTVNLDYSAISDFFRVPPTVIIA
jgi:hypothetical protein